MAWPELHAGTNYNHYWDVGTLAWVKGTQPTGGAGGGGAATIADGADVAQGATTDAAVITDVAGTLSGKLRGLVKWAFERMPAALSSQGALKISITDIGGNATASALPISGTVTATGPLTDTQLRASAVPVSLATAPTTPVTGPLTDTQLRATAVPVSLATAPTTPVTGPLTDTQLRATAVPVSGPLTDTQLRASAVPVSLASAPTTAVTGPLTDTQLRASAVPVSLASAPTTAVTNAGLTNIDVALSTRLKPADTLAGVTTVGTVTTITNAVSVTPPTLTKGTQGSTGFSVQQIKDAGRNTRIFMLDAYTAAPVTEAVQSVVQWYGNAAVGATVTPAVVPAGKTLRLTGWKIMYQSLATVGYAVVRIRANTGGTGAISSPLVASFEAGSIAGATTVAMTGALATETGDFTEGLEFPAGTGLAFSMAGYGPTGALTAEGGVRFQVYGYEY